MCDSQKYKLLISDKLNNQKILFDKFPELDVTYIKGEIKLCPSYYNNNIVCVQAGNVQITLEINGKFYDLTSNMKDKIKISDGYNIKGIQPLVLNKSKDQTYIIILVEHCKESKTYNLGQPFIMEFNDNPTTGYSWKLKLSLGLKLIHDKYSDKCQEGITGCGGTRTYVLEGTQKGEQKIIATHGRPWDPKTNTSHVYIINIV